MKQEKGLVPSSSTNITTNNAAATSAASHPMAAEALAAQANFEVTAFHFYHKVVIKTNIVSAQAPKSA